MTNFVKRSDAIIARRELLSELVALGYPIILAVLIEVNLGAVAHNNDFDLHFRFIRKVSKQEFIRFENALADLIKEYPETGTFEPCSLEKYHLFYEVEPLD